MTEKEKVRFEAEPKPEMENLKEIAPDTEEFDEPEKAKAIIKSLGLAVGTTIREEASYSSYQGGTSFIINPRMVLSGTFPERYKREIDLFKSLCTPLMIKQMTENIKRKRKFENKLRGKFYESFCKKLDNRLKIKSLKEGEAVKYFTQEDSFKHTVTGLHNCVHWLLDAERDLNEFVLAWFEKPIPNTQEWREENDGEYKVMTDSEADQEADEYLDEEQWKMAVEGNNTTSSFEDWKEMVINTDGRGQILNYYDGCEEYEEVDGTDYYIYRTN